MAGGANVTKIDVPELPGDYPHAAESGDTARRLV